MPKLSELLKAREDILRLTPGLARDADLSLINELDEIKTSIGAHHLDIDSLRKFTEEKHSKILGMLEDAISSIELEINNFDPICRNQSDRWSRLLVEHSQQEWQEYMDRVYGYDLDFEQFTKSRIDASSNWQRPSLFFMPDTMRYLDQFFGFYPIYIVDKWIETKEVIKNMVPLQQSRKIRFYDSTRRGLLPQNAMGFILARNYYTHQTIQQLEKDIASLHGLLGPGGVLAFNFNNCEYSKAAEFFENGTRSYTLGEEVKEIILNLGLKITTWQYIDSVATTWVEITKEGKFKSVRGNEALGRIEEIDRSKKKI